MFLAACAGVLSRQAWQEIDSQDPGKRFATEIVDTIRADAMRVAPAAAALLQSVTRIRIPSRSSNKSPDVPEEEKTSDAADLSRAARNELG